jgi:transposase
MDKSEDLTGLEGVFERVCFEAKALSQWRYNGLTRAGFPADCIAARHVNRAMVVMTPNKSHRNDA